MRIKYVCPSGSSKVFKKAFCAVSFKLSIFSRMKTLQAACMGLSEQRAMSERISSTLTARAPLSGMRRKRSGCDPFLTRRQAWQVSQAFVSSGDSQNRVFVSSTAAARRPEPSGPKNKRPCGSRFFRKACVSRLAGRPCHWARSNGMVDNLLYPLMHRGDSFIFSDGQPPEAAWFGGRDFQIAVTHSLVKLKVFI